MAGQQTPDLSDEAVIEIAKSLAPLAGGARIRVMAAHCDGCGEDWWPFGEGVTYTLAAAVLRGLLEQGHWHTDDCPGPLRFATKPEPQEAER